MKELFKKLGKSEVVFIVAIILLLVILALASCAPCAETKKVSNSKRLVAYFKEEPCRFICTVTVDTIQGHEYIIAEHGEAINILHAASCGCMKQASTPAEQEDNLIDW